MEIFANYNLLLLIKVILINKCMVLNIYTRDLVVNMVINI
jgi:hypothetical protein